MKQEDYFWNRRVDADFVGLLSYKNVQDSFYVKSRTGYFVCASDYTVFSKSKLQTETGLGTMEAEYVAFSTLTPLKYGVQEFASRMV